MKAQVEQLAEMSHTLESTGFSRPQSNAVIESVALAMQTFAVTPEILDERISGLREEMNARFAAQDKAIEDLRKSADRLDDRVSGLEIKVDRLDDRVSGLEIKVDRLDAKISAIEQSMLEFQRTMMRYMLAFLVLMLGAVVGMFGAMFSQLFVP